MPFLPIVSRELRVASRRRGTYWVRIGAAVAVIVLGTWWFLMVQHDTPQAVSLVLFGIMTGGAVLYALLSGVRSTADCLSEEKREGTFGLLFLTDLKGYDVVVGKLVASSLNAFYGIIAVLPVLAVPLLMGGVTPAAFERMALVSINTLFFSLCIGMAMSAINRSGRKAAVMTFLLILFFALGMPFLAALISYWGRMPAYGRLFYLPSPGYTFAMAFDSPFPSRGREFWVSLSVVHGFAWLFLVLACLIAPRSWQDAPAGRRRLRWNERWRLWSYGNATDRAAFRRRLLNHNAVFWLVARARLKPASVWAALGLLGCAWAWGFAKWNREWLNSATYIITGLVLNGLFKAWFAAEAGRQLAEDRKQGALELLLATPLTIRDILYGHFLALRRQFLGSLLFVLGVLFALMLASLSDLGSEGTEGRAICVTFWGGGMVMLVLDLVALYWLGLWQGLTARNPNRVVTGCLARIVALPVATWGALMLLISLTSRPYEPGSGWTVYMSMALWFGLGLLADLWFGAWARYKLLSEFRHAAEQRYTSRPGFFRGLFRSPAMTPANPPGNRPSFAPPAP